MMTKGEGGGQKSQKIDDVFYERPPSIFKEAHMALIVYTNAKNNLEGDFSRILEGYIFWKCILMGKRM